VIYILLTAQATNLFYKIWHELESRAIVVLIG